MVLGGCVSVYHRPDAQIPDHYSHAGPPSTDALIDSRWWQSFDDPGLNIVVDKALASNTNLLVATFIVQRAQTVAGITSLDQWPRVSGNVSGTQANATTSYTANAALSYDVDLWRRLASTTSAARWEAKATQEDRNSTELALIGTVCQLYWDIGFTHQQITTGNATLVYQQKILDLVTYQHTVGAVSGVEVAEAQQVVNVQVSTLSELSQHLVEDRAAMAILLGNEPLAEAQEPRSLPDLPLTAIAAGLPAELLARRPDLKAAELRLRETLATGDATRATLYPGLSLTGTGGGTSTELSSLLSHPTGSIAALITLPFLDLGRHRLNDKLAQTDYDIAVQNFRQTLYAALADTDNALSHRTQLVNQAEALQKSLEAATTAERLYGVRYRFGSVALRVWLDAQQSLRVAQLAYDGNRLSQFNNRATLFQALGGGMTSESRE
ncbi:efflux transporter outer membrane subunit [Asticcacaulis sp. MM231]|uniref:efflux transporter outer membrane subunit n=1 Tax=Asticcacaulis sp. MM231 TaxID=3157666 RepID=UPI0032D5AA2A